ncbi:integral membrane [Cordyceps militaris]|uniref:Integral membrane n=1 Tax=Cordyceps militaris TaxID=73501 RepID=A0A2H4SE99_CORMI|nr:integral membrane [Cordyceps militaris]
MVALKTFVFGAIALAEVVAGKRLFYNSGVLKGWDFVRTENLGKITEDKEISYRSGKSLKVTQKYDIHYHNHYYTTLERHGGHSRNDERYYAFMIRLADNWEPVNQSITIAYFVSHRSGPKACGQYQLVGNSIWIKDRTLKARVIGGNFAGKNCKLKETELPDLGEVTPGKWHKIIFHAKWRSDNSGEFRVWLDGKKTVDKKKVHTTVAGPWPFEFRVGLWPHSWHDEGRMEGTQTIREAWFDEISIGQQFKDVDPDMW